MCIVCGCGEEGGWLRVVSDHLSRCRTPLRGGTFADVVIVGRPGLGRCLPRRRPQVPRLPLAGEEEKGRPLCR